MKYFINIEKNPEVNLVRGFNNNKRATLFPVHIGDKIDFKIVFTDNQGGFAWFVGRAGISLKIGIGKPSSQTDFASSVGTYNQGEYLFALNLDGLNLEQELSNEESKFLFFEVQLDEHNGSTQTIHQSQIEVRNEIIK